MDYSKRRHDFAITIKRPSYGARYKEQQIARFSTKPQEDVVKSYSYQNSLHNISQATFSISLTAAVMTMGEATTGKGWYKRIQPMDLVIIEEYGEIRYIGVVHKKSVNMSMSDRGPIRSVMVTGNSVLALMKSYNILLDMNMLPSQNLTADKITTQFLANLQFKSDDGESLKYIVQSGLEKFVDLINKIGELKSQGVVALIQKYVDFDSGIDSGLTAKYPVSFTPFNTGGNTPWSIIEELVGKPYHEVFGQWDSKKEKWVVIIRKTPFNPTDWARLRPKDITYYKQYNTSPGLLSYTLEQSDQNVYTMYGSTAPGSNVSKRKALVLDEYNDTMQLDKEKYGMYGYQPLILSFKFFDRGKAKNSAIFQMLTDVNKEIHEWYKRNDLYLQGTIETMTPDSWMPQVGERIRGLGGEFYIESVTRKWKAMGPATSTYSVSRGYQYNRDGSHEAPIEDPVSYPKPGGTH